MVRYISKPSRQLVIILILGMASGLPISLTASTFYIWLTEAGIRKQDVGLLALVGNFYTLKFLWAPFIDSINIPYITRKLGRRKGWAIVTQICLGISIFLMGRTSPSANLGFTVCAASLVAFFSATQDIVIDAYRIDWLDEANRSLGATCSIIGYRIGALASGAGALFLATYYDWATVYALLALIICFVALMLTFCPEPTVGVANNRANKDNWAMLVTAIKSSYEDFTSRKDWGLLLAFLALYKLGDCFAGLMTNPFLMYMGFSKMEIATIVKTYGFVATTIGVIAGGAMSRRTGDMRGLLICGILQMISNAAFIYQNRVGYDINALVITIGIENFTTGMGASVLVSFISSLCTNASCSASQYAVLSAIVALDRTLLAAPSGFLANILGWHDFFLLSIAVSLPALIILYIYQIRNNYLIGQP